MEINEWTPSNAEDILNNIRSGFEELKKPSKEMPVIFLHKNEYKFLKEQGLIKEIDK